MRGRPGLVTAYQRDMAIFPTTTQRVWFAVFSLLMTEARNVPCAACGAPPR